nr:histidine kinase dimerization/phosphoacceptor domain-containing protein [Streptomyces sp. 846.5]
MRLEDSGDIIFSLLLNLLTGGTVGLGSYLRSLDDRRRRAVADTRQRECPELACELHDFVAHHLTGIVVQTQAARTIREIAPEQVDLLPRDDTNPPPPSARPTCGNWRGSEDEPVG